MSNFIDELETRDIDFVGSDLDLSEFVIRFILGQLGHDWEQTISMIHEVLGSQNYVNVSELNKELKTFDYAKLFQF